MNKKLFFAGFALLAAVSFTSCNSDNPIDITNPNGVTPAASTHYLGGSYDWTAIAKDNAELTKFWNEDATEVGKAIKDKKTINILLDVSGFALDGSTIELPDFWKNDGTGAKGRVVNITISGNFKNADFLRADFIKNGAAKQTKYPVKIKTDKLAESEVNFIFDAEAIDLELYTKKTRSTLNGTFAIGYFYAEAADGMSATEVQSGVVAAIDNASTGDIKEKEDAIIAGLWVKDLAAVVNVEAQKGIPVGTNKYIYAKDVYVEENCTIKNLAYNSDAKKTFKLGTIAIVDPANTIVNFDKDKIYADEIVGVKAENNIVSNLENATSIDLNYIDNIENVTINQATTLKKDVFSGVIFNSKVTFNTEDITSIDDVTFNALEVKINADDVTVAFDKVNFNAKPTLSSTLKYTKTEAWTDTHTYQWIVGDDKTTGFYQEVTQAKPLMEYNKTKEVGTFSSDDVQWDGVNNFVKGTKNDKSADAKKYAVVVINTPMPAGTYTITPEGTLVDLSSACKFKNGTVYGQDDAALNKIWGEVEFKDEGAWYSVKYAGNEYVWRKLSEAGKEKIYVLTK